jgi:glutamate formiminotransferase/formiminotetrahydrofolate cyclodeaminase
MGVLVEGLAQVSMNLTNFNKTPIPRVVEMVRREAQRYGVGIHHSELVGLIPQAALVDTAVWYTQLDEFDPEQILESRLYSAVQGEAAVQANTYDFLDQLASEDPTPGGGSAAAFTAAEAAGLVAMVGRVTVGKKKYAEVEAEMWKMIEQAEGLRKKLTDAVEEDAASFEGYLQALRLPKNTEEEIQERDQAIESATLHAAQVPHHAAGLAMQVLSLAVTAAELGNVNAISDAASAANLAAAAVKCAGLNVMINLKGLKDPSAGRMLSEDIRNFIEEIKTVEQKIGRILQERAGM